MNRSDMRTLFYSLVNETSTNTGFSSTFVNTLLGEGWKKIWKHRNIPWDWLVQETILTNPYTTVSSSSTGTSLEVDSADDMFIDQWLHVTDESVFERVQISGPNPLTTSLTLTSPGLVNTYAAECRVIGNHLELPSDCSQILTVTGEKIESGLQTNVSIDKIFERDLYEQYPRIKTVGTPSLFTRRDSNLYIYPLPDAAWNFWVEYTAVPDDLSDSTEPVLPEQYHDLIVYYAAAEALTSDLRAGQPAGATAQLYRQKFLRGLEEMAAENAIRPDGLYNLELNN